MTHHTALLTHRWLINMTHLNYLILPGFCFYQKSLAICDCVWVNEKKIIDAFNPLWVIFMTHPITHKSIFLTPLMEKGLIISLSVQVWYWCGNNLLLWFLSGGGGFNLNVFFSVRIGGSRLMKRRSWRRPQIKPPDWSIRADERIGPLRVGGDGSRRIEGGNSVTTTPIDVPIDEFFNFTLTLNIY